MMVQSPRSVPDLPRSARRTFLKWASTVSALLASVLVGMPSVLAFLSPSIRKKIEGEEWIKLGEADLFDLDVPTKVAFVRTILDAWVENRVLRNVWVFTQDDEQFTVYNGRCTHLGCGYGYEKVTGHFKCPCHEGVFDVKTGAVLAGPPPRALDKLAVKVVDGDLYTRYQDFRVGIPDQIAV